MADTDWITHRRPMEADGDGDGDVFMHRAPGSGNGACHHWSYVGAGVPWRHTIDWKPPASDPVDAKPAIAVGQRWRRRDGEVVTIDKIDRDHIWGNSHPFWANGRSYTPEGATHAHGTFGHSCDLVELISEADPQPEPPTLTPREFKETPRRTVWMDGGGSQAHTLDAIADDGTAWWMVAGETTWLQIPPMPAREVPADG